MFLIVFESYFKHMNKFRLSVSHTHNHYVIKQIFILYFTLLVFYHHQCRFIDCQILFQLEACMGDDFHFCEIYNEYLLAFICYEET